MEGKPLAYKDRDISVGVGGVVLHEERVLLVKMTYGRSRGRWIIPGGFVEPNEEIGEGVAREVWEETGVQAYAERVVGVRSRVDDRGEGEFRHDVYLIFAMRYVEGEAAADEGEVSEARFWPLDEALRSPEVVAFSQECIRMALRGGGLGPNDAVTPLYPAYRNRLYSV